MRYTNNRGMCTALSDLFVQHVLNAPCYCSGLRWRRASRGGRLWPAEYGGPDSQKVRASPNHIVEHTVLQTYFTC